MIDAKGTYSFTGAWIVEAMRIIELLGGGREECQGFSGRRFGN